MILKNIKKINSEKSEKNFKTFFNYTFNYTIIYIN